MVVSESLSERVGACAGRDDASQPRPNPGEVRGHHWHLLEQAEPPCSVLLDGLQQFVIRVEPEAAVGAVSSRSKSV